MDENIRWQAVVAVIDKSNKEKTIIEREIFKTKEEALEYLKTHGHLESDRIIQGHGTLQIKFLDAYKVELKTVNMVLWNQYPDDAEGPVPDIT